MILQIDVEKMKRTRIVNIGMDIAVVDKKVNLEIPILKVLKVLNDSKFDMCWNGAKMMNSAMRNCG